MKPSHLTQDMPNIAYSASNTITSSTVGDTAGHSVLNWVHLDDPHDPRLAAFADRRSHRKATEQDLFAYECVLDSQLVIMQALRAGAELHALLVSEGALLEPELLELLATQVEVCPERSSETQPEASAQPETSAQFEAQAQPETSEQFEAQTQPKTQSLARSIPCYTLSSEHMSELVGYKFSRAMMALCARPQPWSFDQLLCACKRLLVIEDLVDVANVGALVRNAAALGADGLLVSPGCADPLNRRAIRVSMGYIFSLPWARAKKDAWPYITIKQLTNAGFQTVGFCLDTNAISLKDLKAKMLPNRACALFFGQEGPGLSTKTQALLDHHVVVPMQRSVDSLNVSATTAIACWELFS